MLLLRASLSDREWSDRYVVALNAGVNDIYLSRTNLDIAKSVFQVCVWVDDGSVAGNRKHRVRDCWIRFARLNRVFLLRWNPVQYHIIGGEPSVLWDIA